MMTRHKVTRYVKLPFAALITVVILAGACAPISGPVTPTRGPVRVRVVTYPYLSFAPIYIAHDEGFFAQQGLDVELVQMQGNTDSLPVLLSGDVDVDSIFTVGMLNAVARGENVRVVANKGVLAPDQCPADGFMVRSGLAEQLTHPTPALLKSLKYGVSPTWLDNYLLDQVLTQYGLSVADVATEYLASPAARMEALANGGLDAAFFSEPWLTQVQENGAGQLWLSAAAIAPNYPLGILAFGPNLLGNEARHETGVRFLRAYLQGVAQLAQGKTDRNIEILAQATQLEPALLKRICWPSYTLDGQIDAQAMSDYSAWAAAQGLADKALSPAEFWDPQFVEAAGETGNAR